MNEQPADTEFSPQPPPPDYYPEHRTPSPGEGVGAGDALIRNVAAGARLALMRPVAEQSFVATVPQVLALLAITVVLSLAGGLAHVEWPVEFSPYSVANSAGLHGLSFLGIVLVAWFRGSGRGTLQLATMLVAAAPIVTLVYFAASFILWRLFEVGTAMPYWILYGGYGVWTLAVCWRGVNAIYAGAAWTTLGCVALYGLLAIAPSLLLPQSPYWYTDYTAQASAQEARPEVDVESVYYAQPGLLEAAAGALVEQRAGIADIFFVAYGGYASEDVFKNEVQLARELFETRFDAGGRTVGLVNNRDTIETLPLANAHNLEHALASVGARMDADEDLLVLFLTSHGSQDARLATRFWPLGLNDLEAPALRQMLDASGAKWRVVIVSACYSGSFIDALKDEHTLVLTSSRADRTSFGCGPESELTYFGRHFFANALPRSRSFLTAFDEARESIAAQESLEEKTPSQPQKFVGSEIERKLREVEREVAEAVPGS